MTIIEDIFVLKMEGANVVLGCQWLEKLSPVTMDQRRLTMEFMGPRGIIRFTGDPQLVENEISGSSLRRLFSRKHVSYFYKLQIETDGPGYIKEIPEVVQNTLNKYKFLFNQSTELPPERQQNHHINLLPQTSPINAHPYRYPQYQKTEIERLTKEMLNQGLIRPSTSPFSSPVLLVKKKTARGGSA